MWNRRVGRLNALCAGVALGLTITTIATPVGAHDAAKSSSSGAAVHPAASLDETSLVRSENNVVRPRFTGDSVMPGDTAASADEDDPGDEDARGSAMGDAGSAPDLAFASVSSEVAPDQGTVVPASEQDQGRDFPLRVVLVGSVIVFAALIVVTAAALRGRSTPPR